MSKQWTVLKTTTAALVVALSIPAGSAFAATVSSSAKPLVLVASGGWAARAGGNQATYGSPYGGYGYGYEGDYDYGRAPVETYGQRRIPYGAGYGYDDAYNSY